MAGEWVHCTLADACCAIDYGLTASASNQTAGPKFLRITDIVSGQPNWISVPHVAVNDEFTMKYRLYDGDIVIARTGASTGTSAYIKNPPPSVFASYLVRLQVRPDFDSRFISYYLKSREFWDFIRGVLGDKSAQPNASASTMTAAPLSAPKGKAEQRAIAHILGTLDDKIELNRRMNETLEAMARALFKDWFVDFGPARAKAEGRDPYLAPEIWDLFPDKLDEDGKPVEWKNAPLKEFFSIIGGGTPKTSVEEYWDGEIPWFSVVDTPPKGSVFVTVTDKSITERGLEESSARLIPEGTTIISARGTVGNLAMAAQEMAFNQSCYALRANDRTGDCSVYLAAQHMMAQLQSMAHGSVFSTITRQTFEAVSLPMPSHAVTQAFEAFVEPLFLRIKSNVIETTTLAQARDLLLPKLISGEIRVGDVDKFVQEST